MESKVMKLLAVMMVAFVAVAGAQPVIFNGSFELVDDLDGGPNDKCAFFADLVSISGIGGWNAEMWVTIPSIPLDLGECQNAAALPGWPHDGDFSSVRTGNNWLRLAADWDTPGGVSQNLGPMVAGETYIISVDVFSYDMGPAYALIDYKPTMELYAGSIDPANLIGKHTISMDNHTGSGALYFDVLTAQATATDTSDLILRLAVPDPMMSAALRGGMDNVRFVPEPATMMLLGLGGLGLIRRKK